MLKKLFKNQKGMGIAITIMSLVLIAILGTALVIRGMTLANVITKKNYSITAVEAAKAGVSYAVYMVEQDPDCNTPLPPTPLTTYTVTDQKVRGYYEVQIKNNINGTTSVPSISGVIPNIPPGKIEIVSTGYCGYVSSANYKSKARVIAIGTGLLNDFYLAENALTGDEGGIIAGNGDKVVPDPAYNPSDPNTYADIGTNSSDAGAINLGGNPGLRIKGDIYVNSDDENVVSQAISGGTEGTNYHEAKSSGEIKLKHDIKAPDLGSPVTINVNNIPAAAGRNPYPNYNLVPNQAYALSGTISKKTNIVLSSGTYVFTTPFDVAGQTEIKLNIINDEPVEIYFECTGNSFTGQSIMRASGTTSPGDIRIFGSDGTTYGKSGCRGNSVGSGDDASGDIKISGQGDVYCLIYAPDSNVKISGNGNMYGAATTKNFFVSGNGLLTFPTELRDLTMEGGFGGIDNNNITWSWSYGY